MAVPRGCRRAQTTSSIPASTHRVAVIAAVEVDGLDVCEQAPAGNRVQGGIEQGLVVAVGAVGGPAHRDPQLVAHQGPLPAGFAPVSGVSAGAVAAAGRPLGGSVDGRIGQVEAHDARVINC